jgi:proline iminopeptidase
MIFTQPELFAAYVGTGQFVAWTDQVKTQHAYAVARARDEEHSDVLAALADFDGPPSQDIQRYLEFRALTRRYLAPADLEFGSQQPAGLLLAPRVSVGDIWNALQGARASLEDLTPALLSADLRQLGDDIPVPFVLLQGDSDRITPTSLAVKYFESVRAPSKVHVEISDAGHYAFVTHPNQFRESLVSKVLPLVAPSTQPDAD